MKTPDRVWLIDMGGEIAWCASPDPSGGIHPDDVCEYIRKDKQDVWECKHCGTKNNGKPTCLACAAFM